MTKQEQRVIALDARRAMRPEERAAASAEICGRLASLPALRAARTASPFLCRCAPARLRRARSSVFVQIVSLRGSGGCSLWFVGLSVCAEAP